MAGRANRPERERTAEFQMNRRRFTDNPGYGTVLPRVFPYRLVTDADAALHFAGLIVSVGRTGFAITSSSLDMTGRTFLWLSADNVEYLEDMGYLARNTLELTQIG